MKQAVFCALMLRDLNAIMSGMPPRIFQIEGPPVPLKIGIHADVLVRFPDADPAKVSRPWKARGADCVMKRGRV